MGLLFLCVCVCVCVPILIVVVVVVLPSGVRVVGSGVQRRTMAGHSKHSSEFAQLPTQKRGSHWDSQVLLRTQQRHLQSPLCCNLAQRQSRFFPPACCICYHWRLFSCFPLHSSHHPSCLPGAGARRRRRWRWRRRQLLLLLLSCVHKQIQLSVVLFRTVCLHTLLAGCSSSHLHGLHQYTGHSSDRLWHDFLPRSSSLSPLSHCKILKTSLPE